MATPLREGVYPNWRGGRKCESPHSVGSQCCMTQQLLGGQKSEGAADCGRFSRTNTDFSRPGECGNVTLSRLALPTGLFLWRSGSNVRLACDRVPSLSHHGGAVSYCYKWKLTWTERMGFAVRVWSAGQKIRANVPPKGPCWRHRVCHLGAIVVALAARWASWR